ncbi:MAG: Ig domain-containing protein [Vicinamibacterales bacterium]
MPASRPKTSTPRVSSFSGSASVPVRWWWTTAARNARWRGEPANVWLARTRPRAAETSAGEGAATGAAGSAGADIRADSTIVGADGAAVARASLNVAVCYGNVTPRHWCPCSVRPPNASRSACSPGAEDMATTGWRGQRDGRARVGRWRRVGALALVTALAGGVFSATGTAGPQVVQPSVASTTTSSGSGGGATGPVVFGPEDFVRTTALPLDVTRTFRVTSADGPFTLCVDNGGARDQFPFVSRGEVELNDRYELQGPDFAARPPFIGRAVRVRPGLNTIEVEIESARGTGFTVSVVRGTGDACPGMGGSANRAPSITTSAITSAVVGQAYTYDVNATDADNDPLTYALTTSPSGMTIVPGTGVIAWTPSAAGTFPVVVSVSDGRGGVATQSFSIVVPQPNRAPTFTSSPVLTGAVNQAYAYDADATDADNDPLTYALTTSPGGMTIVAGTGVIAWGAERGGHVPGGGERERRPWRQRHAELLDRRAAAESRADVHVEPGADRRGEQDYAYDADATDADNDPLTYALTTAPGGMTIVPGTGVIAWTPSAAGTFPVVVSVSDGRGGSATQSFSIVVPQPNRAPTFTSSPVTTGTMNRAYAYDADATDADNDPLTYALTTRPAG